MSLTDTIFVLILLIACNAFLALAELSIASAKRIKLMQLRDAGEARASVVLHLKDNPNSFLGIVQIGLNVVAILAGVFGEAAFNVRISSALASWGMADSWLRDSLSFRCRTLAGAAWLLLCPPVARISIHAKAATLPPCPEPS